MTAVALLVTGMYADIQDFLTVSLIPALFALVLIGMAVVLSLKYLGRGVKKG